MKGHNKALEEEIHNRNKLELNGLATTLSDLSMISANIRDHLKSEKGLFNEVDEAFSKNNTLLGRFCYSTKANL